MTDELRVAIDCPVTSGGQAGGVEQFLMGFVSGLSDLDDDSTEFILVMTPRDPDWLAPYASDGFSVVTKPWDNRIDQGVTWAKQLLGPLTRIVEPLVRPLLHEARHMATAQVPDASDFYRSLDVDVVHFPTQKYTFTDVPNVYNPWDLQHLHFPEFVTNREYERRETVYRTGCQESDAIDVLSKATKRDLHDEYGIPSEKVFVMPPAPPIKIHGTVSQNQVTTVITEFNLPESFAFYPAQTWPHKNHVRLLEAIALLRDQHGLRVDLVCAGTKNDFWPDVREKMDKLELRDQVEFTGFVDNDLIPAFYRAAKFTVFPTQFEGLGFPLLEAWEQESAVCCSDISPLSDIAGDAALRFDPTDTEGIARAIKTLVINDDFRESLAALGKQKVESYSWQRTARAYRALYRKVGGRPLSEEDQRILDEATS